MVIWAINGISSAFDLIIITLFFNRRLLKQSYGLLSILPPFILWGIMTAATSLLSGTPLVPAIILTGFILYSFTYKGSRILSAVTVFLAMLLAEIISGILLMSIHGGNLYDIQSNPLFYTQGVILSKLMMFIELNILNMFKEKDSSILNRKTVFSLSMIILSSIVSVYFIAMYVFNTESIISNTAALCVTLIIVIAFICTFNVFNTIVSAEKEKARSKQEQEHYKNLTAFYSQQQKHQQEIQKLNHDMKNVLIGISAAVDKQHNQKALQLISEYLDKCVSCDNDFGDDAISAVILSKKSVAERKGILFEQQVISSESKITDIDICILLGNMLDNAIEACENIDTGERKISLKIRTVANTLYISCKNTCTAKKLNLKTKKADKNNHGIGTKSMMSVIDKYSGHIKFDCINGEFTCEAVIPNQ